jgi:DNA-binding MarR family transcriptional regulator
VRHFPPDLQARKRQTGALLDLGRIQAIVERRVTALFAEHQLEGITPAQSNVLMLLFQSKSPLTARAIHRRLGVSEATISRFVQSLERNGWVARQRDPNDGRAWLIAPTSQAYAALPRFIQVSNQLLDQAFTGFDLKRLTALVEGVRDISANLSDAKVS